MVYPQRSSFLASAYRSWRNVFKVTGAAVLFAACASPAPITPVSDSSQRYQFRGFSVLPPEGYGWHLLSPSGPEVTQGAFGKQTGAPLHTIRAVVGLFSLGGKRFDNPEAFGRFAEANYRINSPESRYVVLELKQVLDQRLGKFCARIDALVEDHGVPGFAGSVFYMASHEINCIHPEDPNALVLVSYSQRATSQSDFIELKTEVEPLHAERTVYRDSITTYRLQGRTYG